MSRILRRPMFRKGGLSSEDTGIVSGLGYRHRQGYEGGADSQGVQKNIIDTLNTAGIEASNLPNIMPPEIRVKDLINTLKYKTGINEVNTTSDFDVMPAPRGVPFISATPQSEYNQKKAQLDILSQPEMIDKLKKEYEQQDLSQISKINPTNLISYINRQTPGTQQYLNSLVEKLPEQYKLNKQQQPITEEDLKNIFKEPSLKENLKESLNALQELGYGPDKDALARQRYLELAKFGFNLASQPTPVGYKANLLNSIARAAEPSVSGLQKINEQQIAEQQALKNSALGLTVKQQFPADRQSAYLKTLLQLGKPLDQAIQLATTGEYRNIAAEQGQIDRDKQTILQSKVVKDQGAADSIAIDIASFRARGINIKPSSIKPIDPTKLAQNIGIENQPYYTPNNDLVIYKNGKYRRANEVGQVNSLYGQ
jgi:hypothetical protein